MRFTLCLAATVVLLGCADEPQSDQPAQSTPDQTASTSDVPASAPINVQLPQCMHAPEASIYTRPAEQWRAEQYGENTLSLTVWRMKSDGNTQFSLYTTQSGKTYQIDTVEGSTKVGEGSVGIRTEGAVTTFVIQGKDQSGNPLTATIKCDKLIPLIAEGG